MIDGNFWGLGVLPLHGINEFTFSKIVLETIFSIYYPYNEF